MRTSALPSTSRRPVTGVGGLVLLAGEQVVQLQVPRQQRAVGRQRLVGQLPRAGVDDRRRDAAVVEQRGVRGEALLAHQLLGVEARRRGGGTGCAASAGRRPPAGRTPWRVPPGRCGQAGRGWDGAGEQPGHRGGDVGGRVEHGGDVRVGAEHPDLAGPGAERVAQRRSRVEVGAAGAPATGSVAGRPAATAAGGVVAEQHGDARRGRAGAAGRRPAGRRRSTGQSGTSTPGRRHGHLAAGRPAGERAAGVRRGERRVDVPERLGEPAGVDLRAGGRVGRRRARATSSRCARAPRRCRAPGSASSPPVTSRFSSAAACRSAW